jgi:hypothetical protein
VFLRHLVSNGAHLARDVVEQDEKIAFEVGVHGRVPNDGAKSTPSGWRAGSNDPRAARPRLNLIAFGRSQTWQS